MLEKTTRWSHPHGNSVVPSSWQMTTGWRPFLHHISKSEPKPRRVVALKTPKKLPRVLTPVEVQAILDGCQRLRDRLLFALIYDTGHADR